MDDFSAKPLPSVLELIDGDFFDMEIATVETSYVPRKENEFYIVTIKFTDGQIQRYMDYTPRALMSGWMSFLDYSKYPEGKLTKDMLAASLDILSLSTQMPAFDQQDNRLYTEIHADYLRLLFANVLNHYRNSVRNHPYYYYLFENIYRMLNGLKKLIDGDTESYSIVIASDVKLTSILSTLIDRIDGYKNYVHDSIIVPIESGNQNKPGQLILEYEKFLNKVRLPSCYAEASWSDKDLNCMGLSLREAQDEIYKKAFISKAWNDFQYQLADKSRYVIRGSDTDIKDESTEETFKQSVDEIMAENGIINDTLFSKTFVAGIAYFIYLDSVIKKCGHCGRYFINKHYLTAKYCNTAYRNTKATCQETVARDNYRRWLTTHPIHAEYKKAYNKLYLRVRQGKAKTQDDCFARLKKLRDEYYSQYESSSTAALKDKTIQRFLKAAEKLYIQIK